LRGRGGGGGLLGGVGDVFQSLRAHVDRC
jgi:hypothetical protein